MQLIRGSTGERRLQEALGTRARADQFYARQMLDHLNPRMREFVASQEMMFVATADGSGECDNTFRAGPEGFVAVIDENRLAWPEYKGNGVLASLANMTENPHVGLLFMDFVNDRVGLHVNGSAEIVMPDAARARFPDLPVDLVPGRKPQQWVVVEVHEAYIHCSKHIPRMRKVPTTSTGQKMSHYFVGGPVEACVVEPRHPVAVTSARRNARVPVTVLALGVAALAGLLARRARTR